MNQQQMTLRAVFNDGFQDSTGGKILCESNTGNARIYIHNRKIAWVIADQGQITLADILTEIGGVKRETMVKAVRICQKTGENFGVYLEKHAIISEGDHYKCMLLHNAYHLSIILEFRKSYKAKFVKKVQCYNGKTLFSIDELRAAIQDKKLMSSIQLIQSQQSMQKKRRDKLDVWKVQIEEAATYIPNVLLFSVYDMKSQKICYEYLSPNDEIWVRSLELVPLLMALVKSRQWIGIEKMEGSQKGAFQLENTEFDLSISLKNILFYGMRSRKNNNLFYIVSVHKNDENPDLTVSVKRAFYVLDQKQ